MHIRLVTRFRVDDDGNRDGVTCHCRTCQKLHTSASYNAKSETGKVHVSKGSPRIYDDNKSDSGEFYVGRMQQFQTKSLIRHLSPGKTIHRAFCGDCGSHLWSTPDVGSTVAPQTQSESTDFVSHIIIVHAWRLLHQVGTSRQR